MVFQRYMGPNFLTQPDPTNIQQTQPNSTHLGTTRPDPTRPTKGGYAAQHYFKYRLLLCVHVKIKTNMRHKREHSINIKLSSVTRRWLIPSRIPIGLARLLPLCRLSWSAVSDSNSLLWTFFWKFYYFTQPNPTHGWTLPMYISVAFYKLFYVSICLSVAIGPAVSSGRRDKNTKKRTGRSPERRYTRAIDYFISVQCSDSRSFSYQLLVSNSTTVRNK